MLSISPSRISVRCPAEDLMDAVSQLLADHQHNRNGDIFSLGEMRVDTLEDAQRVLYEGRSLTEPPRPEIVSEIRDQLRKRLDLAIRVEKWPTHLLTPQ